VDRSSAMVLRPNGFPWVSESMFDERAQVVRRGIGNPNHGEVAHHHRPDLGGLADEAMAEALPERDGTTKSSRCSRSRR
jgi:hypothetical protein